MCECHAKEYLLAVSDAELMGVIANVQGTVIVNKLLNWISYTDCSVTSIRHACLFPAYLYMLVLISVIVI